MDLYHVFPLSAGRRFEGMKPGEYKSTLNPTHPVSIEGHWADPTADERRQHDTVHQLQTHLQEVVAAQQGQQRRPGGGGRRLVIDTSKRLYTQPTMVRSSPHTSLLDIQLSASRTSL